MSELAHLNAHRNSTAEHHYTLAADKGWGSRLVWTLACLDMKLRYRGSLIGPFWLKGSTVASGMRVGALSPTVRR